MRLNYYYNFKNTIRFFMDIENIDFSCVDQDKKTWSVPFKFRIKKDDNSFRTLQIPNIYNFKLAYDYYKDKFNDFGFDFEKLEELDENKRMEISYDLGEFKENSYNEWQLRDYNQLINYDLLIRCDISSFYDTIYTHYIFNAITNDKKIDKPISHMYGGRTAGIIMGNYISLYLAELFLAKVSKRLETRIKESNLNCNFSYFSDDFYFFALKNDKDKVIKLFDDVLEEFQLKKNNEKIKVYDYLEYTSEDVIEKYWKIITRKCKQQQHEQKLKIASEKLTYNNNLFFTNQLIYRLNKLEDYRKKRVFIVNFFKSQFFRGIDFSKTYLDKYNYHQILYLIKNYPEIVLYIDSILDAFDEFKSPNFIEHIVRFYNDSLITNFNDEQLYFYYLLNKLKATENIKNSHINMKVLNSNNCILISYYIINNMFSSDEIEIIKANDDESYWLVHYYLILNCDDLFNDLENSIEYYLIPKSADNDDIKAVYKNFYMDNLKVRNNILVSLNDIKSNIEQYFKEKDKNK